MAEIGRRSLTAEGDQQAYKLLARRISPLLSVLHGPFKGLIYPNETAWGSTLIPKLVGSYEKEIHPWIDQISNLNYDVIIDIGAAEGYYAVGLALRFPNAKIIAFEVEPFARERLAAMAALNGVAERIEIRGLCDAQALMDLDLDGRCLIVCDAEGHEQEIFDAEVVRKLENHDLIIEFHDFVHFGVSRRLAALFHETHVFSETVALEDLQKALQFDYSELNGLTIAERRRAVAEYRPAGMSWGLFASRRAIDDHGAVG